MTRKQICHNDCCFCVDSSLSLSSCNVVKTWSVLLGESHHTTTALFNDLISKLFVVILILCVCVFSNGGTALVLGHVYCLVFVNYITVLFDMRTSSVCI